MLQQKIAIKDNGSRAMRILEVVTPINGITAPGMNAKFLGQLFVDETAKKVYISVGINSVVPANDWKEITNI